MFTQKNAGAQAYSVPAFYGCVPPSGGVMDGPLFPVLPECGHVFERLALGLGNKFPDEEGCYHTDDAVESVGEPVTEVIALGEVHVEHGHER